MSIEFPYIPCDIVGLDIEDILGNHIVDYYGELHKKRLSSEGEVLSTESWAEKNSFRSSLLERAEKEMRQQQGCMFDGWIEVQRVPGNFHIGTHAFGDIIAVLERKDLFMDFSYKIHHLSFGEKRNFESIKRSFPDTDLNHPLDGFGRNAELVGDRSQRMKSAFYL
mmetsp:Transcript_63885/g.88206  ORF Transcript_63885/g.88206 Transcript_63885/m.88206 type:complete len:166 (+) Transcript_63885:258-755(+)|eukprot:CAMPEP_0176374668 /NCGR_PEP_ID=MMETSP0126-20121128/26925_1 /TAXON_ID=141414 ORGANISM="Strombidinopsis acuminatum, Strain SPMC142" /NCGR_SAMPLE_ID=MMETSP0126 /ASSEMBLY_ACC=CAM_ASM_000229 /LENGTH=165 /DNA_ID=CAMNT_0017735349 /DNA_START=257 /DNA_END=754 /DNA_ORIENTATION=-